MNEELPTSPSVAQSRPLTVKNDYTSFIIIYLRIKFNCSIFSGRSNWLLIKTNLIAALVILKSSYL